MIHVKTVWHVLAWSFLAAAIGWFSSGQIFGLEHPWVTGIVAGVWMFVWSIRVEARKVAAGRRVRS